MNKNQIITIAVIVIILGVGGIGLYKYFTSKNETVYYWRTSAAEKGDLTLVVTATGNIAADTDINVGTQVTGIVSQRYADFNTIVKKGQLLALIDSTLYYAALKNAQAAVAKSQAQLDEYQREFDRTEKMFNDKVAAQADYDLALANLQEEKAQHQADEAAYLTAHTNLIYTKIKSPLSGQVLSRDCEVGNMVIASMASPTLFEVVNTLSQVQAQADVDEADIGQVKLGQKANFTVDAFPDEIFTGTVAQIRVNPVMIQNVVNYIVIIEAPNPDLKLIPGLTTNVNILIQNDTGILKIPSNALAFIPPSDYIDNAKNLPDSVKSFWQIRILQNNQNIIRAGEDPKVAYIWVKKGNDLYPRKIRKGITDGVYTEVTGDIQPGEVVVTGNYHTAAAAATQSQATQQQTQNPFMPQFHPSTTPAKK